MNTDQTPQPSPPAAAPPCTSPATEPEAGAERGGGETPEPQSAVEWVKARMCKLPDDTDVLLSEEDALALARRCDEVEKIAALALKDASEIRTQLAAEQAEARELREALEWLEEEAPHISHDAWTGSVDMSGDRWTLMFRNDGKRERICGRTLIDAISKARAALAKHAKEE